MRLARGQQLILRCGGTDAARQDTPPEPVKECEAGHSKDPLNIRRLFAWRRARRVRARLPPPPPSPANLVITLRDRSRGLPPISSLDSGEFSGHGRGAGEVSRAGGEVAAGVRVIVSRARFGGPGLREPCTTDPVSVGSAERRIPGWIPASPGICRFKHFSHRGGRAHGTFHRHPGPFFCSSTLAPRPPPA